MAVLLGKDCKLRFRRFHQVESAARGQVGPGQTKSFVARLEASLPPLGADWPNSAGSKLGFGHSS